MRERVNSYVGFAFVGSFSVLMTVLIMGALSTLPMGLPPPGGF